MKKVRFESALIDGKWESNVTLKIDEPGIIQAIEIGASREVDAPAETCNDDFHNGFAIPSFANVHSHAFQFRFAGQSEYRTQNNDSFWSWREQMYASLKGFDADIAYENAKRLYQLMASRGYSSVGEFHYVHAGESSVVGPSEMVHAHISAAVDVGIRICVLPVLYQRGGFDNRPLEGAQERFGLTDNSFLGLISEICDKHRHALVTTGMAIHSLRAVEPNKIGRIVEQFNTICDGPVHIHVAEQKKEVADCLSVTDKRPVELLYECANVNEDWCLIHATHLNDNEIDLIAKSGAVVGLCPTTEANLGDGVFRAEEFMKAGGKFSVGSDSHVSVCPFSELRLLEYGQRLTTHRRAVLCSYDESCGDYLCRNALQGGLQAIGQQARKPSLGLHVGDPADFIVVDAKHPGIDGVPTKFRLDRLLFGEHGCPIETAYVAGNRIGCA